MYLIHVNKIHDVKMNDILIVSPNPYRYNSE